MSSSFGVRWAALLMIAMPLLVTAPSAQTAAGALKPPPDAREGTAATETWTDHLKITTSVSVPVAPPGDRVSLIAEIEPGARIHVYAPGADNYRVVTLTVAAHQGVRLLPMKYPASEIYFFEPLNERIPVFQQPFKMIQELILETGPKAQAAFRGKQRLTLSGTLDYQACDDRICFNPVSVPLSWTIALRPEATEPHGRTAAPR